MAGKKVVQEPTSKTARASMAKKGQKPEGFKASGDMNRIISLGGGTWAYLLDPRDGRTHHVERGSEKWTTLLAELELTEHNTGLQSELRKLGWLDGQN